jgi:hypothetical protein
MERTRYRVHGLLMIIRHNGRQWRGLWSDPHDRHGLRRSWPFGEEDPRPYLQKVILERKPGPVHLSCNEEVRSQLRAISAYTGETFRDVLDRLSLQEEARLALENATPVQRVRSIGVDPKKSITARRETVERLERCTQITHERLGHITARLIGAEWKQLFSLSEETAAALLMECYKSR